MGGSVTRRAAAVAATCAVIISGAACGNGSNRSATPTTAPSPAPITRTGVPTMHVDTVARGLARVSDLGFLPDGKILVSAARRADVGAVRFDDPGATIAPVAADLGDVWVRGQAGLLGLAIHADFSTTHALHHLPVARRQGPAHRRAAGHLGAVTRRPLRPPGGGSAGRRPAHRGGGQPLRVPPGDRGRRRPAGRHRRLAARRSAPGPRVAGREGAADRPRDGRAAPGQSVRDGGEPRAAAGAHVRPVERGGARDRSGVGRGLLRRRRHRP